MGRYDPEFKESSNGAVSYYDPNSSLGEERATEKLEVWARKLGCDSFV